jgi:hypothetical protein
MIAVSHIYLRFEVFMVVEVTFCVSEPCRPVGRCQHERNLLSPSSELKMEAVSKRKDGAKTLKNTTIKRSWCFHSKM